MQGAATSSVNPHFLVLYLFVCAGHTRAFRTARFGYCTFSCAPDTRARFGRLDSDTPPPYKAELPRRRRLLRSNRNRRQNPAAPARLGQRDFPPCWCSETLPAYCFRFELGLRPTMPPPESEVAAVVVENPCYHVTMSPPQSHRGRNVPIRRASSP